MHSRATDYIKILISSDIVKNQREVKTKQPRPEFLIGSLTIFPIIINVTPHTCVYVCKIERDIKLI